MFSKDINTCIRKGEFPDKLKTAQHRLLKRLTNTTNENYQPVSMLPILSKLYKKSLYKETENYMENILSNFRCGFRKVFNAQQCLISMIEKRKRTIDKGDILVRY